MLVEKSLIDALIDYTKGRKVVVLQVQDDGKMDAGLLDDFLEQKENKYLVDVPAYNNPDFESAVHRMSGTLPDPEQIVAAVHETQEESSGEEILPPPHEEPEVDKMPSAGRKRIACDYEVLKGYIESGKTDGEIADLECVSVSTVKRWICENGLAGIRKRGRKSKDGTKKHETKPRVKKAEPNINPGYNADRYWCNSCQYRAKKKGCDYYMHTDKERGCDPENCDKYVRGPRLGKEK